MGSCVYGRGASLQIAESKGDAQTIAQLKDEVDSLRPPAPPPAANPDGNPREGS